MSCIEKSERGAADAQPVSGGGGGGDIEARQHKARRQMQDPIYF
jgi:hypothetical protein